MALTPEAVEACHQIGVKPESLMVKNIDNFFTMNEPIVIAETRFLHY
jgi:hypothetical protein